MALQPKTVFIDGSPVNTDKKTITGSELRALSTPAADNVWIDLPDAQDRLIALEQVVEVRAGMRFFTDRVRTIYIDKVAYEVRSSVITEAELRQLPSPAVADDHGIWRDVQDDLDDFLAPGEILTITEGERFFTKQLPERNIRIIVNARAHTVRGRRVSYEQVVALAFPDGPTGENITYTVTYTKAAGPKPAGTLAAGGAVRVKEGTVFNVAFTDKS